MALIFNLTYFRRLFLPIHFMFVKRGATEISMLSRMYIKGFINTFLTCKEVLYGWGGGMSFFTYYNYFYENGGFLPGK